MARRSASASPGVKSAAIIRGASPAPGRSARLSCAASAGIAQPSNGSISPRPSSGSSPGKGCTMPPWIGPWPHDRHLDHQVVVPARPQPRSGMLICARLSIWNTPTVGGADHVVGGFVALRDLLRVEAAPARRQHRRRAAAAPTACPARGCRPDQAERVEVVLVPLDHGCGSPCWRSPPAPAARSGRAR